MENKSERVIDSHAEPGYVKKSRTVTRTNAELIERMGSEKISKYVSLGNEAVIEIPKRTNSSALVLFLILKSQCYGNKVTGFINPENLELKSGKSSRTNERNLDALIRIGAIKIFPLYRNNKKTRAIAYVINPNYPDQNPDFDLIDPVDFRIGMNKKLVPIEKNAGTEMPAEPLLYAEVDKNATKKPTNLRNREPAENLCGTRDDEQFFAPEEEKRIKNKAVVAVTRAREDEQENATDMLQPEKDIVAIPEDNEALDPEDRAFREVEQYATRLLERPFLTSQDLIALSRWMRNGIRSESIKQALEDVIAPKMTADIPRHERPKSIRYAEFRVFELHEVDLARKRPPSILAQKERFGRNPETDHPASRPAYDSSRSKRNRRDTGFVPRHVLESQSKYGKFYDMFASAQKERAGAETVVLNNSLPSAPDYPQNVLDAYAGYAAADRLD